MFAAGMIDAVRSCGDDFVVQFLERAEVWPGGLALLDRRTTLLGAASLLSVLSGGSGFAQPHGASPEGRDPLPPGYPDPTESIVASLPITNDYVAILKALADLSNGPWKGPDGHPYNQRWTTYANPLIVRMWADLHIAKKDDCTAWCGIALGWCLMRSGRAVPPDCKGSQSFLSYGTEITSPLSGDIVVFTDYADTSQGHVTTFVRRVDEKTILVLGGNQDLSERGNCPGVPVSAIDEKSMLIDNKHVDETGKLAGKYVHKYLRAPAPVRSPVQEPPPRNGVAM